MVGRGLRLAAVDIGSQPAEEPGAGIGMQVVNGRAPYAVAAGIVSAPGVRPSPVVVSVDGTRVARFPGGAVHQVRVARGTHWVRVRLDGPPSAHSLLAVVWYEAEAAPREAVGARP
jgi:hypothetical protein